MRQSGRTSAKLVECIFLALGGKSTLYYVNSGAVEYTEKLLKHIVETSVPREDRQMVLSMVEIRSVRRPVETNGKKAKITYDHFLE